jgi:hypothetical protein
MKIAFITFRMGSVLAWTTGDGNKLLVMAVVCLVKPMSVACLYCIITMPFEHLPECACREDCVYIGMRSNYG